MSTWRKLNGESQAKLNHWKRLKERTHKNPDDPDWVDPEDYPNLDQWIEKLENGQEE